MGIEHVDWALRHQDIPYRPDVARPSHFKMILIALAAEASPHGPFPMIELITERTGMSSKTVVKIIRALHKHGIPKTMADLSICGEHFLTGWDAVVLATSGFHRRPPSVTRRLSNPFDVVYVVGSGPKSPVKIGRTTKLAQRVRAIQCMSPIPVTILWTTPGGSSLERHLHTVFADRRKHGEWFDFGDINPVEVIAEEASRYSLDTVDVT
jgi:hypothetical protein